MPQQRQPDTLQELAATLDERGERAALLVLREDDVETHSYARLASDVDALATRLAADGIGPGGRVAILADNRPEWIVAALAVARAGAVLVPLDAQLHGDTLRHVIEDSTPLAVFTDERRAERLEELGADFTLYRIDAPATDESAGGDGARVEPGEGSPASDGDELPPAESTEAGGEVDVRAVDPDDEAALFYTSGTTGPPKGVPLTHANLCTQFAMLADADLVRDDDRVCLPLPLHHVYPFVLGVLQPLAFGVAIVLPRAFTGPELIRALVESEATVMIGVPRLFEALDDGLAARTSAAGRLPSAVYRGALAVSSALRRIGVPAGKWLLAPLHRRIAPALRLVASGGGPLAPELSRRLEALGWSVAIGYGLTETSPLLTLRLPGKGRHETVGRPAKGVELRIDHDAAPEGSPEDEGEVQARGTNVFSGYLGLPDKTDEAFTADGWFRTGDLGRMGDDGQLELRGRVSVVIVTAGGKNIQPDEVEETYAGHAAIREMALLQRDGELVGLIVAETKALREQDDRDAEDVIRAAVREQGKALSSYQRISDFVTTREALPRTRLGKLRRHLLADLYEAAGEEGDEARGPKPTESMTDEDRELLEDPAAAAVWSWLTERYPDEPLSPDSSLALDLGIDSMEWLELTTAIAERAGVRLPEEDIADIDSVRDLLRAAGDASEGEAPDLSENPEAALDETQRRWLRPLPAPARLLAALGFGLNRLFMRALFRIQVEGADRLDGHDQVLLAPNHLSALDPFLLAAVLDRRRLRDTYWGGWVGIAFANPLVSGLSRLARVLPIDPQRGPLSGLALAASVLERGDSLVWFPEGERSDDGELRPLKPGIGVLLAAQGVTVIPVHLVGTGEALPRGSLLPRAFRRLRVRFGEAVDAEQLNAEGDGEETVARVVDALHQRLAGMGGRTRQGSA